MTAQRHLTQCGQVGQPVPPALFVLSVALEVALDNKQINTIG